MAGKRKWFSIKVLFWLLAVGMVVVLIVLAALPGAQPVDLSTVARGSLRVSIQEEGETRVRDRYMVSAPIAGQLTRIELEPGDRVLYGETALATLLPSVPALLDARTRAEAEAGVRAAEAAVELARAEKERIAAELRFAEKELARTERLVQVKALPEQALDEQLMRKETARESFHRSEFALRNSEHQLSAARAALVTDADEKPQPVRILAPIDGVVLNRYRESEAMVAAGEPLVAVGDTTKLEIVADLLSSDAVKVKPGQKVIIERWGGEPIIEGNVRLVEPSGFTKISALGVEEQRVNVIVDLPLGNEAWSALGDGYRVELNIVIWENEDVLKVPTGALFRQGDQWAVFVREGDRATLRTLDIGRRNALEAEVTAGLEAGEEVVIYPGDAIADGVALVQRETQ